MSRRRGEFEHRTSIFEGAYRAWSHLGGLEPEDIESKPAAELDPLTNPIQNDSRLGGSKARQQQQQQHAEGTRREYPYEPLPRIGLSHPYVQAILSPWLGPDADNEAIQLGLTTLRTWWQHRRKGESGSAIAALGTEKMKGVVEGYTRHFFTLALCLVKDDREQPPRTLFGKTKDRHKNRALLTRKKHRDADDSDPMGEDSHSGVGLGARASMDDAFHNSNSNHNNSNNHVDANLSPLERLHAMQQQQRRQQQQQQQQQQLGEPVDDRMGPRVTPLIPLPGKCIPGKVDLPDLVDRVMSHTTHASQLVHRGTQHPNPAPLIPSTMNMSTTAPPPDNGTEQQQQHQLLLAQYGDPNTTPVVLVSKQGDIQIALIIEGITCAHCVKIVETVLKGCNGNKSPIDGILDAAADQILMSVLIKIDKASNAKRIAAEAARNLALVGYIAKAKEMGIIGKGADEKCTKDLGQLSTAFDVVTSHSEVRDIFDWSLPCMCPDNGVMREDCPRHDQMNQSIFDAFDKQDHVAGCGMKYGMECTCGPDCRCINCPTHRKGNSSNSGPTERQSQRDPMEDVFSEEDDDLQIDQQMEFFGMQQGRNAPAHYGANAHGVLQPPSFLDNGSRYQRNQSLISFSNAGLRNFSITSETTFGRAMSGLSALSIDWENLEDFDVEVDHSAHITPHRRSSLRRSFLLPFSRGEGLGGAPPRSVETSNTMHNLGLESELPVLKE